MGDAERMDFAEVFVQKSAARLLCQFNPLLSGLEEGCSGVRVVHAFVRGMYAFLRGFYETFCIPGHDGPLDSPAPNKLPKIPTVPPPLTIPV
jgi:hypothetical protein